MSDHVHDFSELIPEQQPAIVVAVGEPAGDDGADEIEDAHRGEQACRLHLRDAEIQAHRDQMHLDEAGPNLFERCLPARPGGLAVGSAD